jgi:hypothetical protein
VDRRTFLGASVLGVGTVALGGSLWRWAAGPLNTALSSYAPLTRPRLAALAHAHDARFTASGRLHARGPEVDDVNDARAWTDWANCGKPDPDLPVTGQRATGSRSRWGHRG